MFDLDAFEALQPLPWTFLDGQKYNQPPYIIGGASMFNEREIRGYINTFIIDSVEGGYSVKFAEVHGQDSTFPTAEEVCAHVHKVLGR